MPLWSSIINNKEKSPIVISRGEFTDSARGNRSVPFKLYLPENQQGPVSLPLPLIVWSHGLGGSRDGAGFISRYIASYGYAVLHIQHLGTDSSLWEGKPGHPWDVIRAAHISRRDTLQRLQDVPFALTEILKSEHADKIDASRIGMSGHSFGAMTTQTMAGQRRGTIRRLYDLFEPRFKCGIAYSPVTVHNKNGRDAEAYYSGIRIPMFFMTGTEDGSPVIKEVTYKDRLEVFDYSGGPEQSLLILEGGDHMVYNGSRGQLAENPKRDIHEKIIRVASLAFWEAYLKEDEAARDWLTGHPSGGGFADWLDGDGSYKFRK